MEAFKLLSRSTKLKTGTGPKENRSASVWSEGRTFSSPVLIVDEAKQYASGVANGGKKRKRGDVLPGNRTEGESPRKPLEPECGPMGKPPLLAKEALSKNESGAQQREIGERFSPEECHSIFKSHRVKIAALMADVSNDRSATTKRDPPSKDLRSRKKQKEASRLYTQPLTSFQSLSTRYKGPRTLLRNIQEQGYKTPTEVQLATIPLLLDAAEAGVDLLPDAKEIDLLTIAPTGSGKTLAFLAPLIHKLVQDHHRSKPDSGSSRHPSALILAPTKELVGQIVNEGRKLCTNTGVSITAVRKGMHVAEPIQESGPEADLPAQDIGSDQHTPAVVKADVLVTTPLLLQNIIADDKVELPSIRHLILDEADVLLDPLFRDQTLALWNACTNSALRASLWSATIGSNIEELALQILNERRTRLDIHTSNPILRCVIGLKDSALPSISHRLVYTATEPGKLLGLRQLLHPCKTFDGGQPSLHVRPPFLVFAQTIERAIALHAELLYDISAEAGGSSRIAVLHSDLSDLRRSEIMTRFRRGEIWILITTDLLSRGVDFRGVNGIVNYDIPTSTAAYVHRAGRTGRAGREGGVAITFYTKDDIRYVKAIANAIAVSEKARDAAAAAATATTSTQDSKPESDDRDPGLEKWLLNALPDVGKKQRRELKKRGVDVRRRIRDGDDDQQARKKRRARISTKSGYDRRLDNRRKGAMAAGRGGRLVVDGGGGGDDDGGDWGGFES